MRTKPIINFRNDGKLVKVCSANDNVVAVIYQEVDGYYVFDPYENTGFWTSHVLKIIANKLDELNKEYNKVISQYFNKELKTLNRFEAKSRKANLLVKEVEKKNDNI